MAEISKEMKIVFIINAIIAFIYTIFYLVIPEIYAQLTDAIYFDPVIWRDFGGTLLILGIFCLVAIKRAEWEQVKMLLEIAILFLTMLLIISLVFMFIIPAPTAEALVSAWVARIVLIVLIIMDIYFYQREGK